MVCIDHSWNRLQRFKEVMRWYTPREYHDEKKVETLHGDATNLGEMHNSLYDRVCCVSHLYFVKCCNYIFNPIFISDKFQVDFCCCQVLVDVPCFTDRHVLHADDNNIFRPSRIANRLEIQHLQRDLL